MGGSIALVGGGPRAVFALERLVAHGVCAAATTVTIFDPSTDLGVGAAYEADLPGWARLNLRADAIDAGLAVPGGPARLLPSFEDWRRATGAHDGDQFPARALAGRYLTAMAGRLAEHWGDRLCHVREFALLTEPDQRAPGRWRIQTGQASYGNFDEVLVLTGHAPTWPGQLPGRVEGVAAIQALPLPSLVARAADVAGPQAAVLIRGAALTAIDTALAFTSEGGGQRPRLTWWSRTGRLMEAKPGDVVRARLRAAMPVGGPEAWAGERPLGPLIQDAAAMLLGPGRAGEIDREWARLTAPVSVAGDVTAQALRRLRTSISIASGRRPPDARWALGEAWRWLYPVVVARAEQDCGPHPAGWPGYRELSPELERLAFGPPLVNARILAGLLASGRLRVRAGGTLPDAVRATGAGLVVDAVLAPPGLHLGSALWSALAERGLARTRGARRGVDVDGQARVIGADGAPVPGLSAAGRVTEDVVIGNDTLTRVQHPGLDRWGARMAARLGSDLKMSVR
ncbi:FAD/NAD(P)-binding protein [Tomitella biformata]|uniref:FAD/NAD(P)-binding protein n=1 Tax=Tomitella biformata TaxID=630403 RepID=UPI000464C447|nr:FAD/NAD(P)-binding protein [Tomitella biformata]